MFGIEVVCMMRTDINEFKFLKDVKIQTPQAKPWSAADNKID